MWHGMEACFRIASKVIKLAIAITSTVWMVVHTDEVVAVRSIWIIGMAKIDTIR